MDPSPGVGESRDSSAAAARQFTGRFPELTVLAGGARKIVKLIMLGMTGAGKTTTAKIIADLAVPNHGVRFVIGRDVHSCTLRPTMHTFRGVQRGGTRFDLSLGDTQGLRDTSGNDLSAVRGMADFVREAGGVNLFVLPMPVDTRRFSPEFQHYMKVINAMFGNVNYWTRVVVVLTGFCGESPSTDFQRRTAGKAQLLLTELFKEIMPYHRPFELRFFWLDEE
jgi:hypothetical protein